MAAIAASDGTREGVRNAVFSGSGITIPADTSVLGKSITIDPASGDVDAIDITVEVVKDGAETTVQAWVLKK
jgi:branched-chain amino acid transport system substrate-binding protein